MPFICFIPLMPNIFYEGDHRRLLDHLYDTEKRSMAVYEVRYVS